MKTYTIAPPRNRINQSIRDALGLDVAATHGHWIIAAPNITFAVHLLRARGFPDWPSDGAGLIKADGHAVNALTAAGRLDEEIMLVRAEMARHGDPVAVVDKGGDARRIGVISDGRFTPDNDHLTGPERAAMDVWLRGSADTTGMLYAVRAALAAAGVAVAPDARERLARHLYLQANPTDPWAAAHWDAGGQHVARAAWLQRADLALAVITGQEN
ncbi:hypothetical protein ACFYUR_18990 [Micromonospora haikouensis]|uniref:hypothetical protein n=1 Tax=Micromonospora haikouensis TaxID=686309 RepID=UPI0036CF8579